MKNAKKIGGIGRILMVLGSILYVIVLLGNETKLLVGAISALYVAAIVLMLVGFIGGRKERKAAKEAAE